MSEKIDWLLEYSGTTKLVAEWGIAQMVLTRNSLASDILEFRDLEASFTDAERFQEGLWIKVFRRVVNPNGTTQTPVKWFEGRIVKTPKSGSASGEEDQYIVEGPWWVLDNWTFQQSWQSYNNATQQLETIYKSHVILGQATNGTAQNSGAQIQEAVDYINSQGGNIQFGTAGVDVNIPVDDVRDITCAEVVKKMLRWSPDAVTWFDYSTSPPTFHCQRRANLTAEQLDADPESTDYDLEMGDILRRTDLVRPSVVIKYEQATNFNGVSATYVTEDKAPNDQVTGREEKALNLTINLQGYSITHTYQEVAVQTVAPATLAWWKGHFPYLKDSSITDLTLVSWSRQTGFANELVDGQLAAWMRFSNGNPVTWGKDEVKGVITYKDGDNNFIKKMITAKIVATNAVSGLYSTVQTYDPGEPVPVGIAQHFYDALNQIQFEGTVATCKAEIDHGIRVGDKLNIANGRAEWASMDAVVWSTSENFETGKTTIKFGPSRLLTAQDLIELSRVNRNRLVLTNLSNRTTAVAGSNGNVELPKQQPGGSASGEIVGRHRLIITKTDEMHIDLDSQTVYDLDGAILPDEEDDVEVKMRKVPFCNDGEDGFLIIPASAFIPDT